MSTHPRIYKWESVFSVSLNILSAYVWSRQLCHIWRRTILLMDRKYVLAKFSLPCSATGIVSQAERAQPSSMTTQHKKSPWKYRVKLDSCVCNSNRIRIFDCFLRVKQQRKKKNVEKRQFQGFKLLEAPVAKATERGPPASWLGWSDCGTDCYAVSDLVSV